MKQWLENKIEGCDELEGMEKEKWAFTQCLKQLKESEPISDEPVLVLHKGGIADYDVEAEIISSNSTTFKKAHSYCFKELSQPEQPDIKGKDLLWDKKHRVHVVLPAKSEQPRFKLSEKGVLDVLEKYSIADFDDYNREYEFIPLVNTQGDDSKRKELIESICSLVIPEQPRLSVENIKDVLFNQLHHLFEYNSAKLSLIAQAIHKAVYGTKED